MNIKVKLFASVRDICGYSEKEMDYNSPLRVNDLLHDIINEHAGLMDKKELLLVAVNEDYATPETLLNDGDVVAIFPPVSGG